MERTDSIITVCRKSVIGKQVLGLIFSILLIVNCSFAQIVFTVNKTTDPDPFLYDEDPNNPEIVGTLQWAVRSTNDATGSCIIEFNIPGTGPHTIALNYELPAIKNQVIIDGTTQSGYSFQNPSIIIDGQSFVNVGLYFYNVDNTTVSGLNIRNFTLQVISVAHADNITITSCVINDLNNGLSTGWTFGITLNNSKNCTIQGNIIGTDNSNPNIGIENCGIFFWLNSNNNIIGGIGPNEANIITYCGNRGVWIGSSSINNKISGNIIYSNPEGIIINGGGNIQKPAPVITGYNTATNILTGTSQPGDFIEIFGSTGTENANEYLQTVTADVNGNWSTTITNNTYSYCIATATDVNNNTSQFSKATGIEVCNIETLTYEYDNVSDFNSTDTVVITINLPSYPSDVVAINMAEVENATVLIDTLDVNEPVYTIFDIDTNVVLLNYYFIVGCENFDPSTQTLTNSITVELNDSIVLTENKNFSVNSPWIILDTLFSTNINYNMAQSGVPFERTFYYKNTSTSFFTGDFKFTDIVDATLDDAALKIDTIDVITNAAFSIISRVIFDTSAVITVRIDSLGIGDSLVFKETVRLVRCPDGFNNKSFYYANYGCSGDTLCVTIDDNLYTVANFDPNDRPEIEYTLLTTGYPMCWTEPQERIIRIVNTGEGNADSVYIGFTYGNSPYGIDIGRTDSASFGVFYDSLLTVPVSYYTRTNNLYYYTNYYANITDSLAAGDTMYIRYFEIIDCIDSAYYDSVYNHGIAMHWSCFPCVRLLHPCFPTETFLYDDNEYGWRTWEHDFGLAQFFNNMIGSLDSGATEWFEIPNSTPLDLGSKFYNHGFIFNMDSSKLIIELVLDPGLGLIADSLYMQSVLGYDTMRIYPDYIEYNLGADPDTGNGDLIIAHFSFPDSFYVANILTAPSGFIHRPTTYYTDFFNNFTVRFQLHAYCEYIISGGKAKIRENVLFVPNINCNNDCALPLSSVRDEININCPGCILPGWNLGTFALRRINLGYADDNNNNFPDSYPYELTSADTNLANIQSIMIGDTIECYINGRTSDGEAYRFDNIGFDFKYGQFLMQGKLLDELEFIGATGAFTGSSGTYNFTIPQASGISTYPAAFILDLSIDSLHSYGVDTSVKRFWWDSYINVKPRFVVKNNLINGTGFDPYYSIEAIDAVFNMSGVLFTGIQILTDANNMIDNFDSLDSTERSGLMYWCTGTQGRVKAIGTDFIYFLPNITHYAYTNNPCYNSIYLHIFTELGSEFIGTYINQSGNQVTWNSFAYELRNLWMLDTITFTFPDYYEIDSVFFNTTQLTSDSITGVTSYTYNPYYSSYYHNYDLSLTNNAIIDDTSITIFPAANFAQITFWNLSNGNPLNAYDETKRYRIYPFFKIKDYHNTPDTTYIGDTCTVITYWSNFPGTATGDTIIYIKMASSAVFTKPITKLETQYSNFVQNSASADLSWDVDIRVDTIFSGNVGFYNITRAENSFIYFTSASGNITIDSLLWRNISYPDNGVDTANIINNLPLFALDFIGNYYYGFKEANLEVYASYDCSQIIEHDTIFMLTGWNCYKYPDTLLKDSVCYMDTTIIPFTVDESGLQVSIFLEDTVSVCDTITYELFLNSTTQSDVDNISIVLEQSVGGEYSYLPGSAYVIHINTGDSIQIEPDTAYTWNLDTISFLQSFTLDDSIWFIFDIVAGCDFGNNDVVLTIYAENYCERPIVIPPIPVIPPVIQGYPEPDSLSVSITADTLTTCGDSSLVTVIITNLGSAPTGAYNTIDIELPASFNYLSGYPVTILGQTATLSINSGIGAGNSETYEFYIQNLLLENCGTYDLIANLYIASDYYCDTNLCIYELPGIAHTDTTIIVIQKPDIIITDITGIFCAPINWEVTINLSNISDVTADSLEITYLCIENSLGPIVPPCTLGTETVINLAGSTSTSVTNTLTDSCTDCDTLIAVVNANCICEPDTSIRLYIPDILQINIDNITNVSCFGEANGSIELTVSGGTPVYTFSWSGPDGFISSNEDITGLVEGTYDVTVTDANLCTTTASVTITEPPELIFNAFVMDNVTCNGDCDGSASVFIMADSYSYLWSDPFSQTTPQATGLCAGNYTVTVTDNYGCTFTSSVTITEPPLLTVTISSIIHETCSGANDGSATIEAIGGTPEYSYLWPSGNTSDTDTNFSLGNYEVTVTDLNGCSAIINVTINDLGIVPVADFTIDTTCLAAGEPISFTNNSTPTAGVNYLWDFGDSATDTIENPVHTYSFSGIYNVTLTVTNFCGTDSSFWFIKLLPDECACISYDIPDGTVYYSSENWLTNKTVEGTVTITSGNTLTISDGAVIRFGPWGKIIVEPGARLNIYYDAILTSLLDTLCNYMWQGIEVWGDPSQPSLTDYQGLLLMKEGAIIENAHIGVLLGKTIICFPPPSQPYLSYDLSKSGGIIMAYESNFRNNGADVKFFPYEYNNSSEIKYCNFYGGQLLDPGYTEGNVYEYPNYNNPWYINVNPTGRAAIGILQWDTKNITFVGNHFNNLEIAMESIDAKYNVSYSSFNNHRFAIRIYNIISTIEARHEITNCTFTNTSIMPGITGHNIMLFGGRYDIIKDCIFGDETLDPSIPQENNDIGIYTENTGSFKIINNIFYKLHVYGIAIVNSSKGGGIIGPDINGDRNEFTQCRRSIGTYYNNLLLKLRCNDCVNNIASEYDRNWRNNHGYLAAQGSFPPGPSGPFVQYLYADRYPAGNTFKPPGRREIDTDSNYPYDYYRHDSIYTSDVVPAPVGPITVYNTGINYNPLTSCLPLPFMTVEPVPVPKSKLDSMSGIIDSLQQEYIEIESNLDNGNTTTIINAINNNISNGKLKNLMVNNSSLSDTVLILYLNNYNSPPGHFKLIITPNLPVSDKVKPHFDNKLKDIPPGIANQLNKLQVNNPGYVTLTSISRQIEFTKVHRQLLFNQFIMNLISDTLAPNSRQYAIALLEEEVTINTEQTLIATYIADNKLALASSKLAALPSDDPDIADWIALNYMLLDLAYNGKTVFEMDSAQEQLVRNLANNFEGSLATTNARAILHLVYGEEFPLYIPDDNLSTKMASFNNEKEKVFAESLGFLGNNYPNPFNNNTIIPYFLPERRAGRIKVFNINGRIIQTYSIKEGYNELELETSKWNGGVYIYCIEIEEVILQYKKMILIK